MRLLRATFKAETSAAVRTLPRAAVLVKMVLVALVKVARSPVRSFLTAAIRAAWEDPAALTELLIVTRSFEAAS